MTEKPLYNWSNDRWQVLQLSAAQALFMSATSLLMTVTALTGSLLADDPSLATLPLAIQFVGVMCATIPASLFMGRVGRKIGFFTGYVIGALAGLLAVYAVFENSYWLFVCASFGLGINNAFGAFLRFAAAECVDKAYRPKAISYVLAGGLVAAFLGPWLATETKELFAPVLFAGGYMAMTVLYLGAAAVVLMVRFNKDVPSVDVHGPARPLREIARQPAFITAVLSGTVGYGIMSLVMTATPLAMVACGFEFEDAAFVIQWHVVGMFLPSFFTGHLINRFGVLNIILVGAALNGVCMAFTLSGIEMMNFWFGLVALGVGWNFMFIGGSSLLTECYRETERSKVQACNDFLVFAAVAAASFSSGALQNTMGWDWVNIVIAAPLSIALIAVIFLILHRRRVEIKHS